MKELILCDTIQRIIGRKHALQEKTKAKLMFKIILFFKKQKEECKGGEPWLREEGMVRGKQWTGCFVSLEAC